MNALNAARFAIALSLVALASTGCGDDGGGTGSSGSGGGGTGDCPGNLTPAANSEFCATTLASTDCTRVTAEHTNQVCGVPLKSPPAELARNSDLDEFGGSGAPDVSCFSVAGYPPPAATSQPITLHGFVRIFSNGCFSENVNVEVFRVEADGQLGASVGSTTTPASCREPVVGELDEDVEDCDERWECAYEIEGVPSDTPLAVKTSGGTWQNLVAYNVYAPAAEIVDGGYEYDPRALATDDYGVIAQAAIGRPITAGNGAIAGEVHDCGDFRLTNAIADVDVAKLALTYFSSDEDNPLPDLQARGTSKLGLYSAIDVVPGPATVAAIGTVGGQIVSLGQHKVYVYPDTVTSLTFRGLRPQQVPAQ